MFSEFLELLPPDRIKINENMKSHTSFKIGGEVDLMVLPQSRTEIQKAIAFCQERNIPFFVFGLGSNLLVRDKGFRGVAIKLGNCFKGCSVSGEEIYAEAGLSLSELSEVAAEHSLTGLEFAEGIPGSLGGAVVMNAGAYDGEMKDVLLEVVAIDFYGEEKIFQLNDMQMAYRKSVFQEEDYIVVSALLKLKADKKEEIKAKMHDFAQRRREKQPLDLPSAGSTFKRPNGFFVGPMLEKMGLKGFSVGGAQVSDKHAGFIVNTGNATAADVLNLIAYIQDKAQKHYGVNLQPELRVLGEE